MVGCRAERAGGGALSGCFGDLVGAVRSGNGSNAGERPVNAMVQYHLRCERRPRLFIRTAISSVSQHKFISTRTYFFETGRLQRRM